MDGKTDVYKRQQTKREITGSITNVTAEDFNQGLTRNAADLLQGKVAGLTINTGAGDVTGNSTIQLRGMSTLQLSLIHISSYNLGRPLLPVGSSVMR